MRRRDTRLQAALVVLGLLNSALGAETEPGGSRELVAERGDFVAWRLEYGPGEGAALHAHAAPRLVVVLSGGVLEIVSASGERRRVVLESGSVSIRPPESHSLINVGDRRVVLIEMELSAESGPAVPQEPRQEEGLQKEALQGASPTDAPAPHDGPVVEKEREPR
jgi:quercetin dioxygenase-like cupin family protein